MQRTTPLQLLGPTISCGDWARWAMATMSHTRFRAMSLWLGKNCCFLRVIPWGKMRFFRWCPTQIVFILNPILGERWSNLINYQLEILKAQWHQVIVSPVSPQLYFWWHWLGQRLRTGLRVCDKLSSCHGERRDIMYIYIYCMVFRRENTHLESGFLKHWICARINKY